MTPAAAESLRRAAAHVVVDDVARPELAEADAHHLFRVLRVRDGEIVTVTDGAGSWRVCRATGGTIAVDGDVATEPPPAAPLTIAFALPKMDRPDWIVQKLTELGVDRIVILHAERSVVRWPGDRVDKHLAKLRRVAREAVQQARRVWVPEIVGPLAAAAVLPEAVAAEPGGRPLVAADRCIAIGPEGGWTSDELRLARATVSLGSAVLRVETAALAAAALAAEHSS
ncbi:MAG TPA: RsmE family RNA methyltransferase [Ilumatobacter sp.]